MSEKARRRAALLRLVSERPLSTQAEVAEALRAAGFEAVQTTVSRDLHDLGLVKVRAPDGRLRYAPPGTADHDRMRELGVALRRFAQTVETSGNLVLVTTPAGCASALAQVLDDAEHPHVLGTIAGDNTILVVAPEGVSGAALRDELRAHLLAGAA